MDKLLPREKKRYQIICQVQSFLQEGCSYREISKRLGIGRNTISKYKSGDPIKLCRSGINQSKLGAYREEILKCLANGYSKSKTVKYLYSLGYQGAKSTAFDYLIKMETSSSCHFEPQTYVRTYTEAMKYKTGSKGRNSDYLTRSGIFRYLWTNNSQLTPDHLKYIFENYPQLSNIQNFIREFRKIFTIRSMPELYLFIEKYSQSEIPEFKRFVNGLFRDIDAVENAVASNLSNGFVEGTNSKLKMIKRTMYGRCSQKLLSAKMMIKYGN